MKKILFLVSLLALFVLSCGAKSSKDSDVIKVGVIGALTECGTIWNKYNKRI